jgi:hypothetical protein
MPVYSYIVPLIIMLINVGCARILYSKAQSKEIEWAMFGLLGNINGLFVFWFWTFCIGRWSKGKSVFGP